MGRPVILSNGSLMVGLNEQGLVHDFYYPYVGLDNLTTARSLHHKIGVWVDGTFSWVDDGSWEVSVDFETDALISTITMKKDSEGLELKFKDFVDIEYNALCRQLQIINQHDKSREVRVFMHQVFQISRAGRADTALFVPDDSYILDYKGRCSLLIYGQTSQGQPFDQYAIGNFGFDNNEGTFRDAEDGELSGNPVDHGGVDTVMRLRFDLPAQSTETIDYWIVAAASQYDAEKIHATLKHDGVQARSEACREYWHKWLATAAHSLHKVDQQYADLTKKSLMVIKAHIDKRGGILASGDSSIFNYGKDYYCYCWPRDGAYAVWPLIRLGYKDEPRSFFEFCRDTMNPDGYMMHKYQPDRSIGSTWHPLVHNNRRELAIQEDETASVLVMLGEYLEHSRDRDFVEQLYGTLVKPAANFLASYFDDETNLPHASYDLWEEKFLTTTYSTATTYEALRAAAHLAELFEYPDDASRWRDAHVRLEKSLAALYDGEGKAYRKGYLLMPDGTLQHDNTLDVSSLYGIMMFGPEDTLEELQATATRIEEKLLGQSPSGGAPRYVNDFYMRSKQDFTGNPWFVCTLWMAQYYIQMKKPEKAHEILHWAAERTLPSGILSEQIDPEDSAPVGVAPLVWSHAEWINTVLDLAQL